MGGTGGGIAHDEYQLTEIAELGLKYSPVTQCLIEKSIAGFKEIEYEVMRDKNDNAIVVCNMENIDPVGVHTGDSISSMLRKRFLIENIKCSEMLHLKLLEHSE